MIPLNQNNYFIKFDPIRDSHELLKARCKQGLIHRIGDMVSQKYIDRIKYELDVIHQLNFDDYFLVVQDYITYAKQNNIMVGPGRGSVAGSLVSYVLGITNIDPLKYDLIFERFLNKARKSMPDIDVDFMDSRRNEIVDYLQAKYGQQHVAHVITFQKIKLKTGIRDVGRILNIDLKIINLICKKITSDLEKNIDQEKKTNKNLLALIDKYPQLFKLAFYLVGLPRQIGLHAAGIVLSQQKLIDIAPLCLSNDNIKAIQYSKEFLESIGLIKLDILGLSNLSIISDCSEKIKQHRNVNFDLNKINFNDPKVYETLYRGETVGIFQLESAGMTNIIRKINPKSIMDICDTLALFRPGPRDNVSLYLDNKNKGKNMIFINEKIKDILAPTYGIILYQEQVIQIVQKVAKYSLSEADLFRKAISKKEYDVLK
ncbi:DNA polymerase III subunit alpha, partial [bacterium]|nr:DNA polymerase III subunit alpha [bacterium]